MDDMIRTISYTRVSTTEQADVGISLDAQEAAIRSYCSFRGLELVEMVVDPGVSAGKPLSTRPGGQRVLELVETGKVGAVVAFKLDRLFRDTADCLTTVTDWDRRGVALHLLDMGGQAIDTSSAIGRFFLTVMAGAAEMERNLVKERTAAALAHLQAQGRTLGTPGLGYRMEQGVVLEVASEVETVARIKELREGGATLQEIANTMVSEGRQTKRGGQWATGTVSRILKRVEASTSQ